MNDQTTPTWEELSDELDRYKAALLRARVAVYRLLVSHGQKLQVDSYLDTAEEVGLEIDHVGQLQQADNQLR